MYDPGMLKPKQKYIDEYNKLSSEKKRKILKSKHPDGDAFTSMLCLFRMRNLGLREYLKAVKAGNPIFREMFIFRLIAWIVLAVNFYSLKLVYSWNILKKGYTPKSVYFHYHVLSDERNGE
jgi:hypothetical protein